MHNPSKLSQEHREELRRLRRRVDRFLEEQDYAEEIDIEVRRLRDGWFELSGHVADPAVKRTVLGMVPKKKGARRIVDRLHVGEVTPTPRQGAPTP